MKISLIFCFGVSVLFTQSVLAQEDESLQIYGYAQSLVNARFTDYTIYENEKIGIPFDQVFSHRSTTLSLHQLNLFFRRSLNEKASFFVNLEASNSFSSRTPSGYIEIPEGWLSYRFSEHSEFKIGMILPRFNNLLEVRNRLPLFPYLIRPIVYENLVESIYRPEDYRPENAFAQYVYNRPINDHLYLDAAFYVGNSENSFLAKFSAKDVGTEGGSIEEYSSIYVGENTNTALLWGGRVGIENNFSTFKLGISGTYDEDNKTREEASILALPGAVTPASFGEVKRYRIGADLSFMYKKFDVEYEFISVLHNHDQIRSISPSFQSVNLNKTFQYINVTYNISDQVYAFGGANYNQDLTYEFTLNDSPEAAGFMVLTAGTGWNAFENTMVKMQYFYGTSRPNAYMEFAVNFISFGVSTIF